MVHSLLPAKNALCAGSYYRVAKKSGTKSDHGGSSALSVTGLKKELFSDTKNHSLHPVGDYMNFVHTKEPVRVTVPLGLQICSSPSPFSQFVPLLHLNLRVMFLATEIAIFKS